MKPIIGLINFSTLCKKNSGSFISSRESDWETHKQSVLSRSRLEERLFYFEQVSLKQFDSQVDVNYFEEFRLVILISTLLHDDLKKKVYELQVGRPWMIIEERGEEDWLDATGAISRALISLIRGRATKYINEDKVCFASFRLDDDDFLSTNFLKSLSSYINDDNAGKFVTFSHGFKCCWISKRIVNLVRIHKPLIAIGLSHIGQFCTKTMDFSTDPKTVFSGVNHYKIGESSSVIEDITPGMFIWSQHSNQDTHNRFKSVEIEDYWREIPNENLYKDLGGYDGIESHFKLNDA
ncbi:hypothetical protein Fbal_0445 [Ferrimonas balearica DSM 9799]|uniref:Rhamnosyl transferase n=1 Tax=Ferrimonas balearica (strain DSM 9799 / CCM 4581 / KCTC 23876 / PAT) TaxID=550540 RepID=E1SP10_FERBD|nr:glycosyltransferase [Ferrimonas balearica]ADN74659.1 hypothetical protein Fbal_0445 [Ferrimonas balearica DSM 9799]